MPEFQLFLNQDFGLRDETFPLLRAQPSSTCSPWRVRDPGEGARRSVPQWQRFLCCSMVCPKNLQQTLEHSKHSIFRG